MTHRDYDIMNLRVIRRYVIVTERVMFLWASMWISEYVNDDEFVVVMKVCHDEYVWVYVNENEVERICFACLSRIHLVLYEREYDVMERHEWICLWEFEACYSQDVAWERMSLMRMWHDSNLRKFGIQPWCCRISVKFEGFKEMFWKERFWKCDKSRRTLPLRRGVGKTVGGMDVEPYRSGQSHWYGPVDAFRRPRRTFPAPVRKR